MKKLFDFFGSFFLLIIFFIPLFIISILIFLQDYKAPFYFAPRVSKGGSLFTMIKLRTMIHNADSNKVDSTKADDIRITKIGYFVRKFKLDELAQLINVFNGTMSFVGPRPQVKRDVDIYTEEEKKILLAKPGITDFSSIVFSDESHILSGSSNPDLKYNQLIRPWKSRLVIFYINNQSIILDIKLILLTVYNFLNREKTLQHISNILKNMEADEKLINVVLRKDQLIPYPPPGSLEIVTDRII